MTQLQSAFSHLLLILNDPDYNPIANSTVLDTPDQLDNAFAFLNNVLSKTSRLLLSNDDILPATNESRHDCSSSGNTVLLSSLSFWVAFTVNENEVRRVATTATATLLTKPDRMDIATGTARTGGSTLLRVKGVSSLLARTLCQKKTLTATHHQSEKSALNISFLISALRTRMRHQPT